MNSILRVAELLDKISKSNDPNRPVGELFARELHTEFESAEFYTAIGMIIDQFERSAQNALEQEKHERAKAIYARAIERVRPWLHPYTIRAQNVHGMNQIAHDIDQLFVIGSKLPVENDDIEPALIEVAIIEAQNLQQTLSELDIEPEIRLYLMRLLDTLLMALRSVETIGVEGLSRVFGSFASELARVGGAGATQPEAATWISNARTWAGKIGKGILWTAAFVTAGSHAITDGADVVKLLSGPENSEQPQ